MKNLSSYNQNSIQKTHKKSFNEINDDNLKRNDCIKEDFDGSDDE